MTSASVALSTILLLMKYLVSLWAKGISIAMNRPSNHTIHTRLIPIGYAGIWAIGLIASVFGIPIFDNDAHSDKFLYLHAAYCVFVIFLGEVVLSLMDTAAVHEDDRFKGTIFWLFARLFIIIILTLLVSCFYYEYESNWILVLLAGIMCWLKWEIAHLNNNTDEYVIKEEGFRIIANQLRVR